MKYYISDLHMFDKNFKRPPIKEFIARWNAKIRPKDDVYILGDVGHTSGNLVRLLKNLNGKKHLVKGNWDYVPLKNRAFRDCFVEIADILEVRDQERLILCHYPMVEWNEMNSGTWHLYGHIHNNDGIAKEVMNKIPRAINVSADVIGYMPKSLLELIGGENVFN